MVFLFILSAYVMLYLFAYQGLFMTALQQEKLNISVVGAGNFGTVIANIIAQNGYSVGLWSRREEVVDSINQQHVNQRYLPNVNLDEKVTAFLDLATCVENSNLVFFAIPSKAARSVAKQLAPLLNKEAVVVSTTKGIEAETFKFVSQILTEELDVKAVAALSGPNIAKEMAQGEFTGTVLACEDEDIGHDVAEIVHSSFFRVYTNTDIYGVEMAGALKNMYAIMIGFIDALGLGNNTKTLLITRALAEMSRFAVALGANPLTFIGLAGIGDLLVTCISPDSRNYRVGNAIGQGKTLEQAVESLGQVAEGVNTIKQVHIKAQALDIYMPLVNALHGLLYEGRTLDELIEQLTEGERNFDVEFVMQQ